jgi:hypothetical protein
MQKGKRGRRRYVMTSDYVTAASTPDAMLLKANLPSLRSITVDMAQHTGPTTARCYDPGRGTYRGGVRNCSSRPKAPITGTYIGVSDLGRFHGLHCAVRSICPEQIGAKAMGAEVLPAGARSSHLFLA